MSLSQKIRVISDMYLILSVNFEIKFKLIVGTQILTLIILTTFHVIGLVPKRTNMVDDLFAIIEEHGHFASLKFPDVIHLVYFTGPLIVIRPHVKPRISNVMPL